MGEAKQSGTDIIAAILRRCGGETAQLNRLASVAASMYKIEWQLARVTPVLPPAPRPSK